MRWAISEAKYAACMTSALLSVTGDAYNTYTQGGQTMNESLGSEMMLANLCGSYNCCVSNYSYETVHMHTKFSKETNYTGAGNSKVHTYVFAKLRLETRACTIE